jgi:hypothetical protein
VGVSYAISEMMEICRRAEEAMINVLILDNSAKDSGE